MAYDGYVKFGDTELINLSRTAQLAEIMGIDVLWTDPESVAWIQSALGGADYGLVETAPWYDPEFEASAEFAGIVPLSITGLDDSTLESTTVEYITSGGSSSKGRNKTLVLVANVAILASTDRGADFGKRWLDRMLSAAGARTFCAGSDLTYFQYKQGEGLPTPPLVHRRDVTLTRGTTVTRKRPTHCSVTWMTTYTWTANDPFEYSEEMAQFTELGPGGSGVTGPGVDTEGSLTLTEQECPIYDASPIYDPWYPALVPPPTAPDFYPAGWALTPGVTLDRFWVRLNPIQPSALRLVPVVTLNTNVAARYIRVSIWASDANPSDFCDPLWSAIVSYLPTGVDFVIDGEQEASYAWDGLSTGVRRTDSLVYGALARPIGWNAFNDPGGLLVTLDILSDSADYDGSDTVQAALAFVSKSD